MSALFTILNQTFDFMIWFFSSWQQPSAETHTYMAPKAAAHLEFQASSSAIAERPRDAQVTSIRKIAKWNF